MTHHTPALVTEIRRPSWSGESFLPEPLIVSGAELSFHDGCIRIRMAAASYALWRISEKGAAR